MVCIYVVPKWVGVESSRADTFRQRWVTPNPKGQAKEAIDMCSWFQISEDTTSTDPSDDKRRRRGEWGANGTRATTHPMRATPGEAKEISGAAAELDSPATAPLEITVVFSSQPQAGALRVRDQTNDRRALGPEPRGKNVSALPAGREHRRPPSPGSSSRGRRQRQQGAPAFRWRRRGQRSR